MIARYRQRFPSAMKCMEETLEACLQALRLPPAHHKRLRTANLLERTFGEHKRRTKVIPHFFTEEAAMKLSFAVLLAVAKGRYGKKLIHQRCTLHKDRNIQTPPAQTLPQAGTPPLRDRLGAEQLQGREEDVAGVSSAGFAASTSRRRIHSSKRSRKC